MDTLDALLQEVSQDLQRAEHLAGLILTFRKFGAAIVPAEIVRGDIRWDEASLLLVSAQQHRTDLPYLSGSLILYITGRFEYYVKQLIQAAADEMCSKIQNYEQLPAKMRLEIKSQTLDVVQNAKKYKFDEIQSNIFLSRLVENINGNCGPVVVASEVLSITESNMRDKLLGELMTRIGIADFWSELGKQAPLKILLQKATDKDCTLESRNILNKIMTERNLVAHPTSGTTYPDPESVVAHAKFVQCFCSAMVAVVRVHLATFYTGTAGTA